MQRVAACMSTNLHGGRIKAHAKRKRGCVIAHLPEHLLFQSSHPFEVHRQGGGHMPQVGTLEHHLHANTHTAWLQLHAGAVTCSCGCGRQMQ